MTTRTTVVRLVGAAMMTLAIAPWIGGGTASAVDKATADIFVKSTQVPTTAAAVENKQTDCPGYVQGEPFDYFHFVLDGSAHDFVELTAEFSTGDITITTFGPPSAKHAYVKAPAGSVLNNAYADVTPDTDIPSDFQLSHVCVGTPGTSTATTSTSTATTSTSTATTSTSTATTSTSTATTSTSTATSAPATTTTTAPISAAATTATAETSVLPVKIEATGEKTEAGVAVEGTKSGSDALAATGFSLSLGMTLALSLGLLLGGAALLLVPGRLAIETGRHRRH